MEDNFTYIKPHKNSNTFYTRLDNKIRFQFSKRKLGAPVLKLSIGNEWLDKLKTKEDDTLAFGFTTVDNKLKTAVVKVLPGHWKICKNKQLKNPSFSFILIRWDGPLPALYADSRIRRMKNIELYGEYLRMEFPGVEDEEYLM